MIVTRETVPDDRRSDHTGQLFGIHFPVAIEPAIFSFADRLSPDYHGGYWQFFALGNGGFFMSPDVGHSFRVIGDNGFQGAMSAEAFGITACLYAYSHLSFSDISDLAGKCAQHYHLLRDYAMDHAEVAAILGAID